jgi:SAM-dependent methyltransferase
MNLDYFSAISDKEKASSLQLAMANFYRLNSGYYDSISYASDAWNDETCSVHQDLLKQTEGKTLGEIGCGKAGILNAKGFKAVSYHGCDFSSELICSNRIRFPQFSFSVIDHPHTVPFDSCGFDFVFSIFVLEHAVRPDLLIAEMVRCTRDGGKIAILCPDFAGMGGISSQRMGNSGESGRVKLMKGKFIEAIETVIVSRFWMPLMFKRRLKHAAKEPVFLLNNSPACFHQDFYNDSDAVYVTHEGEIEKTFQDLGCRSVKSTFPDNVLAYARSNQLLYLLFEKSSTGV